MACASRLTPAGLLALTVLLSLPAMAATYIWTDPATGRKVYSDQPPPPNVKDAQSKQLGGNLVSGDVPFAVQDAMRKNPVVLYANNCPPCKDAVKLLSDRGIPYTSKNPESDPKVADELKKLIGALQVPVLSVGGKPLSGFEAGSWNSARGAAGYPKTALRGIKVPTTDTKPASAAKPPAAKNPS